MRRNPIQMWKRMKVQNLIKKQWSGRNRICEISNTTWRRLVFSVYNKHFIDLCKFVVFPKHLRFSFLTTCWVFPIQFCNPPAISGTRKAFAMKERNLKVKDFTWVFDPVAWCKNNVFSGAGSSSKEFPDAFFWVYGFFLYPFDPAIRFGMRLQCMANAVEHCQGWSSWARKSSTCWRNVKPGSNKSFTKSPCWEGQVCLNQRLRGNVFMLGVWVLGGLIYWKQLTF